MKLISVLFFLSFQLLATINYQLSPEMILFQGSGENDHYAFPHAATDDQGNLWLIYRHASNHVGSLGALWLAKYRLSDMALLETKEIYSSKDFDPRDPTITIRNNQIYISFFQYNYTFNMVRQFVLQGDTEHSIGGFPKALKNGTILNHSSAAPMIWHQDQWILPVYYVKDFFAKQTDVGFFSFDEFITDNNVSLQTMAVGKPFKSFFLEPAIAIDGNHWVSLFRTSPTSIGPGGIAMMMMAQSFDGGVSWQVPQGTPFVGHHPRMNIDTTGRMWSGFRDLSAYNKPDYKAKITLWWMNAGDYFPSIDKTITVFETTTPSSSNWDCGYPTWIELAPNTFRVIYYYSQNGRQTIATRTVSLP